MHGFSDAPGNRAGAGDAHDERAFSFKKSHLLFLCRLRWKDQGRVLEITLNFIL
jgi:hypothetical protein